MESKVCVDCNTEKSIDNFYNKYGDCTPCNIQRSMKRYHENKDNTSNQRKVHYEKNRDMLLAKSKINQQNRKPHTKRIKDLNNKVEELTKALETISLKIE